MLSRARRDQCAAGVAAVKRAENSDDGEVEAENSRDATSGHLDVRRCDWNNVRMVRGGVSGLVAGTVFNTDERQELPLAGSIPVRLRHQRPGVRPLPQGASPR